MATATTAPPTSARSRYAFSALLAARAAREAAKVRGRGLLAVARIVRTAQVTQAVMAQRAVAEMLAEQDIASAPDARLNPTAFTTEATGFERMYRATADAEVERLVASLVQDAGRAAESVSVAVREDIGWVRHLNLPSCSRCVLLAGRVYRYSDGFERHPNDDCVTVPVREGDDTLTVDPVELVRQGQVRGLSEADMQALDDGADFASVVNVRRKAAGLQEAGRVLSRAGRPTPEGIYRMTSTRTEAVNLLARFGYIR